MISVVTVYAPRRRNAHWQNYEGMLALQKRTCDKFGHRHVVVTDDALGKWAAGFEVLPVQLPGSLMFAQIAGQIAWLEQWEAQDHTVFVDADVLISRPLDKAFTGRFDILLTNRIEPVAPINNGVMYVDRGAKPQARAFWKRAYSLCADHWGGDQEAIAKAAAPVPPDHGIHERDIDGLCTRIAFMPPAQYNMTPGANGEAGEGSPFAVHFKGDRKVRMKPYAEAYIFKRR